MVCGACQREGGGGGGDGLSHIYVKIIKFVPSNYQMFSWLSGVVQGMAIEKHAFESRLSPFFSQIGRYESDVLFFFLFVCLFVKVLTFN